MSRVDCDYLLVCLYATFTGKAGVCGISLPIQEAPPMCKFQTLELVYFMWACVQHEIIFGYWKS
jgi:hypothetical protein